LKSIAILIGNAAYDRENDLACCTEDVKAMTSLLEAAGRFDEIHAHVDMDADAMRDLLRESLSDTGYNEIFLYFSGHGAQIGGELYFCGTTFDGVRPNETGVSHSEILNLLRNASPKLLVKVIDACFSGALLVKANQPYYPIVKEGFSGVVQFSSSKDDQTSLGGERLSAYTQAFLEACVRKAEGPVYYTDIANTLRDNFLENNDQTPFFVNQGTGRETFVPDVAILADFKERLAMDWVSSSIPVDPVLAETNSSVMAPTLEELLEQAEQRMTSPEGANAMIGNIFDGVISKFDASALAHIFDKNISEHSYYREEAAEDFIIRVLVRESRPDQLVTAEIERVRKKVSPLLFASQAISMALDPEWTENYTLSLNCSLERAQLRVALTPKYRSLQQLQLILSCAPSLEHCYLFEIVTLHPRTDWDTFSSTGSEAVRRWYKLEWNQSVDHIIQKICDGLARSIQDHITTTQRRLLGEKD